MVHFTFPPVPRLKVGNKDITRPTLFLLWACFQVGDAIWIYFYVKTSLHPVPHSVLNRTEAKWTTFGVMMYITGALNFVMNAFMLRYLYSPYIQALWKSARQRGTTRSVLFVGLMAFIATPMVLFIFMVMPLLGAVIVEAIIAPHVWNHACDGYPMYAILDAKSTTDKSSLVNTAYFYEAGSSTALFTYEINGPNDDDIWDFRLRNWNARQASIPVEFYPLLQYVRYDFLNHTVSGNCTDPESTENPNTITRVCMIGTFDSGDYIPFNLTSNVPFNTTIANTPGPFTSARLRSIDQQWFYYDANPTLILKEVDSASGALMETVLETAVTKPGDCTELKVCLAGTGRYSASVVGAEVMAPLGLILMHQADYGIYCTTYHGK